MIIRVKQGKGRKDRETILSKYFLAELEIYWRNYRPGKWLFFGNDKSKAIPVESIQKMYNSAKKKAGINKGGVFTPCGTDLPPILLSRGFRFMQFSDF